MSDVTDEDPMAALKREVDALQVAFLAERTPWYRSAFSMSNVVAMLALVFSFGTTAVAYREAGQKDIEYAREELVRLLARLTDIPAEMAHARARYPEEPALFEQRLAQLADELAVLTSQADFVLAKLPPERVSAGDYFVVAVALQTDSELERAARYYSLAREQAGRLGNFSINLRSARALGTLRYAAGDHSGGARHYEAALAIFDRHPYVDRLTQAGAHIQTQVMWATAEAAAGRADEVRLHMDAAARIAATLPPGAFAANQAEYLRRVGSALGQSEP